jgi:hypothetical protein
MLCMKMGVGRWDLVHFLHRTLGFGAAPSAHVLTILYPTINSRLQSKLAYPLSFSCKRKEST